MNQAKQSGEVLVRDATERSRFEITVDGALAGFSEYHTRPGRVVITHTEIGDEYQGQGLAGKLVRAALEQIRRRGEQITPLCPYVAGYIRKHPEYLALVDERHRTQFE